MKSFRRGVLLLLVLALLALFGMIAVAFVVLTAQARRCARSAERLDLHSDPPSKLLHQAAMQVLRGSDGGASVIGPHSLLETMYGNNSVTGTVTVVGAVCRGQLIEFTFDPPPENPYTHIGCVITMLDGPAKGCSSRIVGFNPTNLNPQMLAFDGVVNQPESGNRAIINGVPFSGTGILTPQPNPIFVPEVRDPAVQANSDYTAVDFQHMLLAMQVPDGNGHVTTPLPSLHRPDLVRYQEGKGIPRHNYILRPLADDHPNFTGSNPKFKADWNPETEPDAGQWDVDNDGDGVPDSVWVDLGMNVRATADGRLYKPLFAILCTDLDGRLNVNAHGCWAQADPATTTDLTTLPFAGGPVAALPRGMGYGPAEINLLPILNNDYDLYARLLQFRYPAAGLGSDTAAHRLHLNKWFLYGNGNYWDFASASNAGVFGSPPDLLGAGVIGLDGSGRPLYVDMGQDINAVPCPYEYDVSAKRARGGTNDVEGNAPFSAAELERVLRPYDRDAASLPDRLARATAPGPRHRPEDSVLLALRHAVTTDSWDVPALPVAGVPSGGGSPKHITDVLKGLLIKKSRVLYAANPLTDAEATALLPQLFPPELLAGRKMDLNRAFGNGLDDGNGVVDGPGNDSEQVPLHDSATSPGKAPSFDVCYDPMGVAADSLAARQLYARYLFVLADLLTDRETLKGMLGASNYDDVARFLAQWAINVVDFRDRDSIMTPFPFDPEYASKHPTRHPSGAGWCPGSTSYCVWGCERPELLITETLAFHDRRTKDLDTETPDESEWGNEGRTDPGKIDDADTETLKKKDASFDQRFMPQGSLFIELYNPWSGNQEPQPRELYDNGGVNLAKLTPIGGSPVWRLLVTPKTMMDLDSSNPPKIDRAVYFASPGMLNPAALPVDPPIGNEEKDAVVKYQPDSAIGSLAPGRYAVIGPGGTTFLGFKTDETPGNFTETSTRRIVLDPGSRRPVQVYNDGTDDDSVKMDPADDYPPIAIAINQPQRFSISEPDGGYPEQGPPDAYGLRHAIDPMAGYVPAYDVPLDNESPLRSVIQNNRQRCAVKLICLQRLANPLLPFQPDPTLPNCNPYRTIDVMPVDLTSFNGITTDEEPVPQSRSDPPSGDPEKMAVMKPGSLGTPPVPTFYAHQRGQTNGSSIAMANYILWRQEGIDSMAGANAKFPIPADANATFNFQSALHHSLGYLSNPFNPPDADGKAQNPFPWLTWNNRPFVNHLELLLVPWTKSSDLCRLFSGDPAGSGNPYDEWEKPFGHMPSFLQCGTSNPVQLYRILDFVGVPSPFVGTETQADPTAASSDDHIFHPPFNRISSCREPSKMNLNTIFCEKVYDGLMSGLNIDPPTPRWSDFDNSRRGGGGPNLFTHPFRSFAGANLISPGSPSPVGGREINATLLRDGPTAGHPLFNFISSQPANYTGRNPFFFYQGLERLGNLVTTRSNVYAAWITVGYFEVESNPSHVDSAHPDGYQLGRELGIDTGEIERHRAFYIFDRSLPVGFQRGRDLNVEKAILIKRYIE